MYSMLKYVKQVWMDAFRSKHCIFTFRLYQDLYILWVWMSGYMCCEYIHRWHFVFIKMYISIWFVWIYICIHKDLYWERVIDLEREKEQNTFWSEHMYIFLNDNISWVSCKLICIYLLCFLWMYVWTFAWIRKWVCVCVREREWERERDR